MQITQEYYTAETQDIPINIVVSTLGLDGKVRSIEFVFSQKVISDVVIRKSTMTTSKSLLAQGASETLGYKVIITTFGRGGAVISNPFSEAISSLGINKRDWKYDLPEYNRATFLTKTPYVSSVSASPAGANVEITTTTSLYLAAPRTIILATAIEPLV